MPLPFQKGLAAVSGIAGSFDVIVQPVAQSGNINQNWEEEIIKDVNGFDTAWLARNQHYMSDFKFKALGDTAADAAAGLTFIAPYGTVTLSGFSAASLNSTWQNISGASIDLNNTSVADFATKFRLYADPTQAALSVTTPA